MTWLHRVVGNGAFDDVSGRDAGMVDLATSSGACLNPDLRRSTRRPTLRHVGPASQPAAARTRLDRSVTGSRSARSAAAREGAGVTRPSTNRSLWAGTSRPVTGEGAWEAILPDGTNPRTDERGWDRRCRSDASRRRGRRACSLDRTSRPAVCAARATAPARWCFHGRIRAFGLGGADGCNVVFADTTARFISKQKLRKPALRAIVTRNGNESMYDSPF